MISLLIVRALMGTAKALERPIEQIRIATDVWAGVRRKETREAVTLVLYDTPEALERVVTNPDIIRGNQAALMVMRGGGLPLCPTCKGLDTR